MLVSGERSRNTWATCPEAGDNNSKELLIPHVSRCGITEETKPQGTSGWARGLSASW